MPYLRMRVPILRARARTVRPVAGAESFRRPKNPSCSASWEAEVGVSRVTIPFCRKRLAFLRRLSEESVRLALRRLGLAWRLRRCKTAVRNEHRSSRVAYCRWVLRQPQSELNRWAYIDGTTFYLARTAALGRYCWRMANGQDSLADRNVGPSAYAKAQGQPIKIWGCSAVAGLSIMCCRRSTRRVAMM